MNPLLKRLHGRSAPPGIEMVILRRMPVIAVVGTILPLTASAVARLLPGQDHAVEIAKQIKTVDILVFATLMTFWTAVLTVSIACFIVFVMKGPAYVADAYPLSDAPRPARPPDRMR